MNLEEAKNKIRQALKENTNDVNNGYEIDENGIIETKVAWYIPFVEITPNDQDIQVGVWNGFIVGKTHGDLHQPGSAFTPEKWLTGYELGLLDGPYDFIVTKINDIIAARQCFQKLHLQFVIPEIENSITWKIPQTFTSKMINERLAKLPCTFKNQDFSFEIDLFKEINDSKIFEYEFIKTFDPKTKGIDERIE